MKTSFEFEYQGHRVKAEYEQTRNLSREYFKLFSFRVLKGAIGCIEALCLSLSRPPRSR